MMDLGCGLIVDLKPFGIDRAQVQSIVEQGVDIICFSEDKLLGGHNAGLSLSIVEKLRDHQ